jgi:hypothetical protein
MSRRRSQRAEKYLSFLGGGLLRCGESGFKNRCKKKSDVPYGRLSTRKMMLGVSQLCTGTVSKVSRDIHQSKAKKLTPFLSPVRRHSVLLLFILGSGMVVTVQTACCCSL